MTRAPSIITGRFWRALCRLPILCAVIAASGPGLPLFGSPVGGAAQDEVANALRQIAPPWYDAGTDGPRAEVLPGEHPAVSRERGSIPEAPLTPPASAGGPSPVRLDWLNPLVLWIVLGGLSVLAGALFWLLLPAGRDAAEAGLADRRAAAARIEHLPVDMEPAGDLRAAALAAARDRDFDRSVVLLFSHALVELDRHGMVQLNKGKTNRQYLREFRSHGTDRGHLGALIETFERVYFGRLPAGEAGFLDALRWADELAALRPAGHSPTLAAGGAG